MVWYRIDKKRTTEDLLKLSIGWLKKHDCLMEKAIVNGELTWKRSSGLCPPKEIASVMYFTNFIGENRSITLSYTYNDKENIRFEIPVVCSFPHYGGKRYWFVCPRCGRKVAFLYGGKYFWCRQCQNLSYPTQQMGFLGRMFEKSRKYEERVLDDGRRKRWVHHSTLEKYMGKAEYYEKLGLVAMYRTFNSKM